MAEIPDRPVADIPLRCEGLGFDNERIVINLQRPATQLVNNSDQPVQIMTGVKGGRWSTPFLLEPGASRDVSIPISGFFRLQSEPTPRELPLGQVLMLEEPTPYSPAPETF